MCISRSVLRRSAVHERTIDKTRQFLLRLSTVQEFNSLAKLGTEQSAASIRTAILKSDVLIEESN